MKWPFLCTLPIFGQDHLWYTPALLRKRSMVVIEDGLANYIESALVRPSTMKHKWLYRLLFGSSMCYGEYGNSKYASQVVLTGAMGSIPACLKEKLYLSISGSYGKRVIIKIIFLICSALIRRK